MKYTWACLVLVACGQQPSTSPPSTQTPPPPANTTSTPPPTQAEDPLDVTIADTESTLAAERAVTLSATVTNKKAKLAWKQASPKSPVGTFFDAEAADTEWTAPAVSKQTKFTLSVSAELGDESSEDTVTITVSPADVEQPEPDALAVAAAPTSAIAGDTIALTATNTTGATAFKWTQTSPASPLGTFTGGNKASASFAAPAVSEETSFTLSLAYKDASGAAKTVNVVVTAGVPSYTTHIKPIFAARCSGCHSGGSPSASFDITKAAHFTANAALSNCGSGKRVVSGDPAGSALYRRVAGTCTQGGARMPYGNAGYFDNNPGELKKIESWISAGAAF